MEESYTKEQMKDFDDLVEKLRQSFKSKDSEQVEKNVGEIFPYVIHYLRERNLEKLKHLGKKLALVSFLFRKEVKNPKIARELGYLEALENVVRKIMDSEVGKEAFEALKEEPRYAELLSTIKREGIIRHDELAGKFQVSAEKLHEIIRAIGMSEAITFTAYGEMRYYSLTSVGEAMYDRVRKEAFLPELAHRLKHIYRLVIDEGKRPEEVLALIRTEGDKWCTEDEILPIIESFVNMRVQKAKDEVGLPVSREPGTREWIAEALKTPSGFPADLSSHIKKYAEIRTEKPITEKSIMLVMSFGPDKYLVSIRQFIGSILKFYKKHEHPPGGFQRTYGEDSEEPAPAVRDLIHILE